MATPASEPIPTEDQADSVSIQSIEKNNSNSLAKDGGVVTAHGNIITKDGVVFSSRNSESSASSNIFTDPEIRDYYKKVYEEAQYECRHVFDADVEWSEAEEKKVVRKLDWHGEQRAKSAEL